MSTEYLDKTGLTYFWQKIKGKSIPYATCSTAKATVKKEVTISGITELETGLIIAVKFANTNTATDPTLQVNSLTAKAIKRYGTTAASTSAATSWNSGEVAVLLYDGSYWQIVNFNNTTYSAMSQSEMEAGTAATARNITAARLKEAVLYHAPVTSVNGSTGAVTVTVPTKVSDLTNDSGFISTETDPTVPSWAKASSKPSYTAAEVGAVPTTRKVNGKALSSDITLSASDVSALPSNTAIPTKTSDLTNDSGFITTETDPTVPSWAKASTKPSYSANEISGLLDALYPVGSIKVTSTNTNPSASIGGTWELIRKDGAKNWVSSGVTFNASSTNNGAFGAILNGSILEMRFIWTNKVAISGTDTLICTIPYSAVGMENGTSNKHASYHVGLSDTLDAVPIFNLSPGSDGYTLNVWNWITRSSSYPTTTGKNCYLSVTIAIQDTLLLLDSWCNAFYWKRTA